MPPERRGHPYPIFDKISQEMAGVTDERKAETAGTPEARAEELFALWQDYRRLLRQSYIGNRQARKEKPTEDYIDPYADRLAKIKQALAERWQDPQVQELFKKNVGRSIQEWSGVKGRLKNHKAIQHAHDQHIAEREKLYQEVFTHRGQEPDELTQIEIAGLSVEVQAEESKLEDLEKRNPELAARLSFERLSSYRKQLATDGFIWTPSREAYFKKIIDHLVVVNQNRPLLLSGETGTGKTRLARAVSKRLTGKPPYEVGEEAKTDIRPLLGSRAIDAEGSYVNYGQLGQALTGKQTSRDKEAGEGGIFYMDEMNGYPSDALRSLVKQISGRRPGEEITFAAWAGQKGKMSPEFGFLGSANLRSEKHPDRSELPVEVARELADLEVDYPPQSPEDPELYEMMLAALMDQNGRIRVPQDELAPAWKEIADTKTQVKHYELETDTQAGGTLWRFANLVADVQRSYKGEGNSLTPLVQDASYLRAAVLDPGLVLSWLQAYRKAAMRGNMDLQSFLANKLETWSGQKTYPEEDRNLLGKFVAKFNLEEPLHRQIHTQTILTPAEIGRLSPRVSREVVNLKEAPRPLEASVFLPDGTEVFYNPNAGQIKGGAVMFKSSDPKKERWIFKGWATGEHNGFAVMENDRTTMLIPMVECDTKWEMPMHEFIEKFEGRDIKLDITETLALSEKFYKAHNLQEFAANLPKDIKFSTDGENRIREALKMGFNRAMILPPTRTQSQYQEKLLSEMQSGYQNPDKFWDERPKTTPVRNRPPKAYLFLYSDRPVPQETKNLNQAQQEALFKQKHWNSWTLPEFRLTERLHFESDGNHGFHAWNNDAKLSNWTRLLDSADSSGSADAYWGPDGSRVGVGWDSRDDSRPRLGARPAVVVEIL